MHGSTNINYSSTLSLISSLDGFGWSVPRHGLLTPWETDPVPILQESGWAPGPVWIGLESLAHPLEFDLRGNSLFRLHHAGPHPKSE